MEQTTTGEYRVHPGRDGGEWLLLDVESGDPTYAPRDGAAADLAAGNQVHATLAFADGAAKVVDAAVERDTRFYFYRPDPDSRLFEAARVCWDAAVEVGEAMASRVTHGTDGEPNGVVYVFAEQPGERDLFAEFRDGVTPLEPLLERAADGSDPPFEAFIIDHPEHPFVAVYIALERGGVLARTVRETYDGGSLTDLGGFEEVTFDD